MISNHIIIDNSCMCVVPSFMKPRKTVMILRASREHLSIPATDCHFSLLQPGLKMYSLLSNITSIAVGKSRWLMFMPGWSVKLQSVGEISCISSHNHITADIPWKQLTMSLDLLGSNFTSRFSDRYTIISHNRQE